MNVREPKRSERRGIAARVLESERADNRADAERIARAIHRRQRERRQP